MKLNEIVDWDLINRKRELMKDVRKNMKPESIEMFKARMAHARMAVMKNYKGGFIDRKTFDRQMKQIEDIERMKGVREAKTITFKKYLQEGTWAAPQTYEQARELEKLMSSRIQLKNAEKQLYHLVGDDKLFDEIDSALNAHISDESDARPYVVGKLREWLRGIKNGEVSWRQEWDPRALQILQKIVREFS